MPEGDCGVHLPMSKIVPAKETERIVGVERHKVNHFARAVSAEQTVYILHSHECLGMYPDLRDCPWSLALDNGIDITEWTEDAPLRVNVRSGRLVPTATTAKPVIEFVARTEPTQTCQLCGNVEVVRPDGRGFPPDISKRKLVKRCKAEGCPSQPAYRAGFTFGPRACAQEAQRP
jgi:hypothetical protein